MDILQYEHLSKHHVGAISFMHPSFMFSGEPG